MTEPVSWRIPGSTLRATDLELGAAPATELHASRVLLLASGTPHPEPPVGAGRRDLGGPDDGNRGLGLYVRRSSAGSGIAGQLFEPSNPSRERALDAPPPRARVRPPLSLLPRSRPPPAQSRGQTVAPARTPACVQTRR